MITDRYCVCGKLIDDHKVLCVDCFRKYGKTRALWPDWLREWAKSTQNEYRPKMTDADKEHDDEFMSDLAAHNLKRARQHPEMNFEDFVWSNQ